MNKSVFVHEYICIKSPESYRTFPLDTHLNPELAVPKGSHHLIAPIIMFWHDY